MAQAKKKQTEQERLRIEQKKHKKLFYDKFKYYCEVYGGKGTFELIPENLMNVAYNARHHTEKIISGEVTPLTQKEIKNVKGVLNQAFDLLDLEKKGYADSFSLRDFVTIGLTMFDVYSHASDTNDCAWKKEILTRLSIFEAESFMSMITQVNIVILNLSLELSDLQKQTLWFEINWNVPNKNGGYDFIIKLQKKKNIAMKIQIDGAKRLVYPVVVGRSMNLTLMPAEEERLKRTTEGASGYCHVSLLPSLLGNKTDKANIPAKVYIQVHAIARLRERLDCLFRRSIETDIYTSINEPKIIELEENKALVEYRTNKKKFGYLVCEYIENIIVVRTFLFLTNNGTPEAQRLYELTGLKKLDKKYLSIDKLSSFINSDISKNESVKELLINAGCESLIDAEQNLFLESEIAAHSIASIIEEYLKKEKVESVLEEMALEEECMETIVD